LVIQYIYNQTPEVCLAAVQKNGYAIQFIYKKNQTPEVCLAAVKQNGYAIQYIDNKKLSEEICLTAVQQNGSAIQFINKKNQTHEVCLAAIQQNKKAIQYIKNEEFKNKFIEDIFYSINSNETCTICIENNVKYQLKNCTHSYCKNCILDLINNYEFKCPYCRANLF